MIWAMSRENTEPEKAIVNAVVTVFFVSGAMALVASRGKHLSWVVFWAIAGLVYLASTGS